MGVDRGYPRAGQQLLARVVEPQVGGVCVAAEVAPLDQHPRGAQLPERDGLGAHGVEVFGGVGVEQHGGLGDVRRDEGDVRQELAHRLDGVLGQQPGTGGGHHDGVEDHNRHRVGALVEEGEDGLDGGRGGEHPDLGGVNRHVVYEGVQLGADEVRGDDVDTGDSLGGLGGQ